MSDISENNEKKADDGQLFIQQATREYVRMEELLKNGKVPDLLRVQEARAGIEELARVCRTLWKTVNDQRAEINQIRREGSLRAVPAGGEEEEEN